MKHLILLLPLVSFALVGCCTTYYHDKVVEAGREEWCKKPFSNENAKGHYIGTETLDGGIYDVFVFKNLIETGEDKYLKIAIPRNEEDWHEDKNYPQEFYIPQRPDHRWDTRILSYSDFEEWKPNRKAVIAPADERDFSKEKKIAGCEIEVPYFNSRLLFVSCKYKSPLENTYHFGFFVPVKKVMKFYGKRRPFPAYVFYNLGYLATVPADIITSPLQIFVWVMFRGFNLGG